MTSVSLSTLIFSAVVWIVWSFVIVDSQTAIYDGLTLGLFILAVVAIEFVFGECEKKARKE